MTKCTLLPTGNPQMWEVYPGIDVTNTGLPFPQFLFSPSPVRYQSGDSHQTATLWELK